MPPRASLVWNKWSDGEENVLGMCKTVLLTDSSDNPFLQDERARDEAHPLRRSPRPFFPGCSQRLAHGRAEQETAP